MIKLALDVGEARIGIAVTDLTGVLAYPHSTVDVYALVQAVDEVARIVRETGAEVVYVGLPVSDDGQLSVSAKYIQHFTDELVKHITPLVPQYVNERYTTKMAHRQLYELGKQPSRNREIIDQMAAVNILESML